MYCPNCGKADQAPETYCRQCGVFLADLSRLTKQESPPEENLKVNQVLSLMTVIASFALAILLYAILGFRENTHWLIYLTAGLLIAIGAWHIQTFIRTRRLRRQWKRREEFKRAKDPAPLHDPSTSKLLSTPAQDSATPATITEDTTLDLSETKVRLS
jgi:ABC-type nickel/cobalt efflux system permease component RcnA